MSDWDFMNMKNKCYLGTKNHLGTILQGIFFFPLLFIDVTGRLLCECYTTALCRIYWKQTSSFGPGEMSLHLYRKHNSIWNIYLLNYSSSFVNCVFSVYANTYEMQIRLHLALDTECCSSSWGQKIGRIECLCSKAVSCDVMLLHSRYSGR